MKIHQILENYKPKAINIHLGGFTGTKIPDELSDFVKTHVKKSKSGNLFVTEYPDAWYARVFQGKGPGEGIYSFKTFMNVLKPYFRVQKILPAK